MSKNTLPEELRSAILVRQIIQGTNFENPRSK